MEHNSHKQQNGKKERDTMYKYKRKHPNETTMTAKNVGIFTKNTHTHTHGSIHLLKTNDKRNAKNSARSMEQKKILCQTAKQTRKQPTTATERERHTINNIYYFYCCMSSECFNLLPLLISFALWLLSLFAAWWVCVCVCAVAGAWAKMWYATISVRFGYVMLYKYFGLEYGRRFLWHESNEELSKNVITTH